MVIKNPLDRFTFPKVYNTYFLACVSTIGGMLFGFDISSISAIIVTDQYVDYFNNPSGLWQGGIGAALVSCPRLRLRRRCLIDADSSQAGGSIVGAMCAGFVSDQIGRRDSIAFGMHICHS